MNEVKLSIDENGEGKFYMQDEGEQFAEMEVGISGKDLTVYHTEVSPEWEGKGIAKILVTTMVEHARMNGLKVIPLCPYVHIEFKRHPEEYADVWNRNEE